MLKPPTYSEFLLRRLHSLTGLLPLGVFVMFHLFANSFSTRGAEAFNDIVVKNLRGLPFLTAIEWGTLGAPFMFHMGYGLWIIFAAKPNPTRQKHIRNWAYIAQRASALVVFVFIIYHVVTLRYGVVDHKPDVFSVLHTRFRDIAIFTWYTIGIAFTAFHLANGLCTFMMTWGITVGRGSQKLAAYAMTGLGFAVFGLGMAAMAGFVMNPPLREVSREEAVNGARGPASAYYQNHKPAPSATGDGHVDAKK